MLCIFVYRCDATFDQYVLEIGLIPSSLTTDFKQSNLFALEHYLSTAVRLVVLITRQVTVVFWAHSVRITRVNARIDFRGSKYDTKLKLFHGQNHLKISFMYCRPFCLGFNACAKSSWRDLKGYVPDPYPVSVDMCYQKQNNSHNRLLPVRLPGSLFTKE